MKHVSISVKEVVKRGECVHEIVNVSFKELAAWIIYIGCKTIITEKKHGRIFEKAGIPNFIYHTENVTDTIRVRLGFRDDFNLNLTLTPTLKCDFNIPALPKILIGYQFLVLFNKCPLSGSFTIVSGDAMFMIYYKCFGKGKVLSLISLI